jgi:cathepsin L
MASYTSSDEVSFPFIGSLPGPASAAHDPPPGDSGPALVVFSGGTAFNSVASHVRQLTTRVTHVLPVSDDGGSTAEIVRVLGGPAVGDIRSRCLRLADGSGAEAEAVRRLLAHRLPSASAAEAKREWYEIVEGEHPLWEVRARCSAQHSALPSPRPHAPCC